MNRVVLLALLGIPVLIIAHVALLSQPFPVDLAMTSAAVDGDRERPSLQGHWQAREQALPVHLVIKSISERGS
jgi:hypothetical protein